MAKIIIAIAIMLSCVSCSSNNGELSATLQPLTGPEELSSDDRLDDIFVVPYSDTLLVMIRGNELWDIYDRSFRYCYMSYKQFRYSFLFKGDDSLVKVVLNESRKWASGRNDIIIEEYKKSSNDFVRKYLMNNSIHSGLRQHGVLKNMKEEDRATVIYILNIMGFRVRQEDLTGYYHAILEDNIQMLNSPSPYSIMPNAFFMDNNEFIRKM